MTNLPNFTTEIKSRFGNVASGATLSSYVATIMIAQAIEGLSQVNAETLYSSLNKMKEVQTRAGVFKIEDRVVQFPMTMKIIRNSLIEDFQQWK